MRQEQNKSLNKVTKNIRKYPTLILDLKNQISQLLTFYRSCTAKYSRRKDTQKLKVKRLKKIFH